MSAEITRLTPDEEIAFQQWAAQNGIADVNDPRAHYDYRGFWKMTGGAPHAPGSDLHFPDTFKQHGHSTFSVESQYSAGPDDGGRWNGDNYIPAGADLLMDSRGDQRSTAIGDAIQALLRGLGRGR